MGEAMKYGESLRSLRESRGLSLDKLSEITGYHQNTIQRMEKGHNVKAITMIDVIEALGCELVIQEKA